VSDGVDDADESAWRDATLFEVRDRQLHQRVSQDGVGGALDKFMVYRRMRARKHHSLVLLRQSCLEVMVPANGPGRELCLGIAESIALWSWEQSQDS
jgi:hypothetical protein